MSDLTFVEKAKFENLFKMSSGYVLDFSDRTFREFVSDVTGKDINDDQYKSSGTSKANKLRGFIKLESNYTVATLLEELVKHERSSSKHVWHEKSVLYEECAKIIERLKRNTPVENVGALQAITDDKDFKLLAKQLRESIEKNEPEAALDRLHTYVTKFIRELCSRHGISYAKEDALNGIYAKYVKHLVDNKRIDSLMTEKILKYSINVLEAFNDIRNNKSFAHDNPILNYQESVLIFNNISNAVMFIQSIEDGYETKNAAPKDAFSS